MTLKKSKGGQSVPSIDKIQSLFWLDHIKKSITKLLLAECKKEIYRLESRIENKQKIVRKDLKDLREQVNRLEGKGKGKKQGIKYTEMQSYFEGKEYDLGIEKLMPDGNDKLGKFSGRDWGKVKNGSISGIRDLETMNLFFPNSDKAFTDGPNSIFKIFKSVNINDALHIFGEELQKSLDSNHQTSELVNYKLSKIHEVSIYKISGYQKLQEYRLLISDLLGDHTEDELTPVKYYYGFKLLSEIEAATFGLALGFIASKFTGENHYLAIETIAKPTFKIIEKHYSVPEKKWFSLKVTDPYKVLEEFVLASQNPTYQEAFKNISEAT